jgi:hypothetical protein
MSNNPYFSQPKIAFWSKSVAKDFNALELIDQKISFLKFGDKVTSAGSCFASNMVPYIETAGIEYVRTERIPKIFSDQGQNLGYANFSAAYGNIYTARQLKQLYQRAIGDFIPTEDRWFENGRIIDPFRPGLKFVAESNDEFDFITNSHLALTKKAFESASVFVFTFGLTESWISLKDGAAFPACPGTIAGKFDTACHRFRNYSVSEIVEDMSWFIESVRIANPDLRFILSVSPVPLVATATDKHVLSASTYSKSVLRVAADELCNNFRNVNYFPAFEIITGPQAPENYFEVDRRNVSHLGVTAVMNALLESSGLIAHNPQRGMSNFDKKEPNSSIFKLSQKLAEADCDEVMLDRSL